MNRMTWGDLHSFAEIYLEKHVPVKFDSSKGPIYVILEFIGEDHGSIAIDMDPQSILSIVSGYYGDDAVRIGFYSSAIAMTAELEHRDSWIHRPSEMHVLPRFDASEDIISSLTNFQTKYYFIGKIPSCVERLVDAIVNQVEPTTLEYI